MWKGLRTVGLSWKKNKGFGQIVKRMMSSEPVSKMDVFSPNMNMYFPSLSPCSSLIDVKLLDESDRHMMGSKNMNVTYPLGTKDCVKIEKGKRLEVDVVSLLSNGGKRDYLVRNNGAKVPVESITGKYLLICCFKVPLPSTSLSAHTCRTMIATYSDLLGKNNFEMVMVAKIASAPLMAVGGGEEVAFNRFFAAFPCLAIPFWDTESRDFVSKSLGLTIPHRHRAALILDPDQVVLQTDGDCVYRYGTSGFPFSDDHLAALKREDEEMQDMLVDFDISGGQLIKSPGPLSLEELFGGDVVLSRVGDGDKMSVSDLSKKKCVILYLCLDGLYSSELSSFHKQCKDLNLEIEIVVVQMAFLTDTTYYVKTLQRNLESGCGIHDRDVMIRRSWWVLPVGDGEAERRLWRTSYQDLSRSDHAIILADGGNAVELHGRQYIDWVTGVGLVFHYPFTAKSMLHKVFGSLRSVTLDSLLGAENYPLNSSDPTRTVAVSELKGRNVLLYVDHYDEIKKGKSDLYNLVLCSYDQMRKDYPESEVVFISMDEAPEVSPMLPWLSFPRPASAIQRKEMRRLGLKGEPPLYGLFAFGGDGLLHSLCAGYRLQHNVDGVSLFADTLMEEVLETMSYYS